MASNSSDKLINFFNKYNHNLNYLMFPPGAGGEYFSGLISRYSNDYVTNKFFRDYGNNKFISKVPQLFKLVASMCPPPMHSKNIESFADQLVNDLVRYPHVNNNIDDMIAEATEFAEAGPRLIRIHRLWYDIFTKKNTYEIYPDSIYWHRYCNYLKVIKALARPLNFQHFCNVTVKEVCIEFRHQKVIYHPKYNKVVEWLSNNDNVNIIEGHAYLIQYYNEFGSFSNIFNMTADEMIEFLYKRTDLRFNLMHHIQEYPESGYTTLPMTKMFENRYFLSTIFNIESERFNDNVIKWHQSNLDQLEKYKIKL